MGWIRLLTGGQIVYLFLAALEVILSLATFAFFDDRFAQVAIIGFLSLSMILAAQIAASPNKHRYRTIRYIFWVYCGAILAVAGLSNPISTWGLHYLNTVVLLPNGLAAVEQPIAPWHLLMALTVAFIIAMVTIREQPPLGIKAADPNIRIPGYLERRSRFVKSLQLHLQTIDQELRWQDQFFVSLRAEVDVRNGNRTRRRVDDLVEAIRSSGAANLFLVLGVPGAGKSVALRKCCMDLLRQQRPSERIPIYVNLKEWTTDKHWTAAQLPTDEDFASFVKRNVRTRLPAMGLPFFDEHFDRLVELGEIFFLFDSFDEIPGILDSDETSSVLVDISNILLRYIQGQMQGRAAIASRYFRRPQFGNEPHAQLDIRPFAERQIAEAVDKSATNADELKIQLFKTRPELGSLARNPFTLSLILLYWHHFQVLPPNQSALYQAFIKESLDDALMEGRSTPLPTAELEKAMADISWAMFTNDRGLEMTVGELRRALDRLDIDDVVDTLVAARLARKAPVTQAVSFVHRRFNEYFLISRWLSGEQRPPFESILKDGRYRDALVLYAEVAGDEEAQQLAEYCWDAVSLMASGPSMASSTTLRGIYGLRFLTEAFRGRHRAIESFRDNLGEKACFLLSRSDDLVAQKLIVEATGLLRTPYSIDVLMMTLFKESRWLQDAAFSACRYLPTISEEFENQMFRMIKSRSYIWQIFPDRDFLFALKIADGLRGIKIRHTAARLDHALRIVIILFASCVFISAQGIVNFSLVLLFITVLAFSASYSITAIDYSVLDEKKFQILFIFKNSIDRFLYLSRDPVRVFVVICGIAAMFSFSSEADYMSSLFDAPYPFDVIGRFGLSLLILILFFPAFEGIYIISRAGIIQAFTAITRELFSKDFALVMIPVTLTFALFFLVLDYFKDTIIQFFNNFGYALVILFMLILAVLLMANLFIKLRVIISDRKILKDLKKSFRPSRAEIAEAFFSMAEDSMRAEYVEWLERQSADNIHSDKLSNLEANPWPNGRRPNIQDSEASDKLAQLDARWLGIPA